MPRGREVWVFVEQDECEIAPVSLELLSKARELAEKLNGYVCALLFGSGIADLAEQVIHYGADRVLLADHPELVDLNYALNPGAVMVNKRWFESLSKKNRAVIEAAMASSAVIRADIRQEEQQALDTIRAAGITPLELSPAQLAKWKLHSRSIYEALIADIGGDAIQHVGAGLLI